MVSRACGVYRIVNTISRRVYIGSARDCHRRWRKHLSGLRLGKPRKPHSEETKRKLSELATARAKTTTNPFKGRSHTDENRANNSAAMKRRHADKKAGIRF